MGSRIEIIGINGIPDVKPGDDVSRLIINACKSQGLVLRKGDILVVTHKIVSKAERQVVFLNKVTPSEISKALAKEALKDPRVMEIILREAKRIVRMVRGLTIAETRHGFVCANAGIDQSNVGLNTVCLLPKNPDLSARKIREALRKYFKVDVAVIISDTFGRPWREGQVDVAIGVAGLLPILDYRGKVDKYGYELKVTAVAVADEIASAAELAFGKTKDIPVALVRGYEYQMADGRARNLARRPSRDIFR